MSLYLTRGEELELAVIRRVKALCDSMDAHPEYQPWRTSPRAFYEALCALEDAYDRLCDYTARTAPGAERVAREAVR